tara:strand:+ start:1788 stop:2345 length:558 start_codon:yes stop_codon:yes gene_type:complete
MTPARRIALGVWLMATTGLSILYVMRPELINPVNLVALLRQTGTLVLFGYIVVSILRPVTLVPSTVLIVVGTLLFPDRSGLVFVVSLLGVAVSSALIYYFFDILGLAAIFERRHPSQIRWLEDQLRQRGLWIVVGWSVFPFVPTDAICYVAGTVRMPIGKFLTGVAIGEIPIIAFYVAGGTWLFG